MKFVEISTKLIAVTGIGLIAKANFSDDFNLEENIDEEIREFSVSKYDEAGNYTKLESLRDEFVAYNDGKLRNEQAQKKIFAITAVAIAALGLYDKNENIKYNKIEAQVLKEFTKQRK